MTEQIVVSQEKEGTGLQQVKAYAELAEVQKRFANIIGSSYHAKRYVESIIISVAGSKQLQDCSAKSIMISAMRAASLQLSVDKDLKQAHLVPMGKEATLIVDYHGLVQLTTATGYYKNPPNVSEVYAGEIVKVNRFSGEVSIEGEPTLDKDKKKTVIGWLGYFKAKDDTERFLYMTNEECDAHGAKYSKSYNQPSSPWMKERDKMRRKTVLRLLVSRWGHFSPVVAAIIKNDEVPIDAEIMGDLPDDSAAVVVEKPRKTEAEAMEVLGFGENK